MNVPGEDAKGVMKGVDLLHAVTDDESYRLHGETVVIGGGAALILAVGLYLSEKLHRSFPESATAKTVAKIPYGIFASFFQPLSSLLHKKRK